VARKNNDTSGRRWLCSHLVELQFEDDRFRPRVANLEEIAAEAAILGVEAPYPAGARLTIKAASFEIPAEVVFRLPRETDFLLCVRFREGRHWDPETWKPDHLYLPPKPKKKLRQAAGRSG
jgi:hypothetical protein